MWTVCVVLAVAIVMHVDIVCSIGCCEIDHADIVSSIYLFRTLSGRIGKVVASSIPAAVALIYTMHEALRG